MYEKRCGASVGCYVGLIDTHNKLCNTQNDTNTLCIKHPANRIQKEFSGDNHWCQNRSSFTSYMVLYDKFSSPVDGSVHQQGDSICRKGHYMS